MSLRLRSDIWVKAYIRRCASEGAMAAVVRHGDDDAGAIFIKVNRLDGSCALFGPAPAGLDEVDRDRRWVPLLDGETAPEAEVDKRLEREADFDGDLWIVEVEARDGHHRLDDWLAPRG